MLQSMGSQTQLTPAVRKETWVCVGVGAWSRSQGPPGTCLQPWCQRELHTPYHPNPTPSMPPQQCSMKNYHYRVCYELIMCWTPGPYFILFMIFPITSKSNYFYPIMGTKISRSSLYCNICFIAVVWNRTHSIFKVCLY